MSDWLTQLVRFKKQVEYLLKPQPPAPKRIVSTAEALRNFQVSAQGLTEQFKELGKAMEKSNEYFEGMKKSAIVMENLTRLILAFTGILVILGLYPVLKDLVPLVFPTFDSADVIKTSIISSSVVGSFYLFFGMYLINRKIAKG